MPDRLLSALRPVLIRDLPARVPITRLGVVLVAAGVVLWIAGALLGWVELLTLAAAALLLPIVGILWTLRRTGLAVELGVTRPRVVVGEEAIASITVSNPTKHRIAGSRLEVQIGSGVAVYDPPVLTPGASWDDALIIATDRRCVLDLGPPTMVAGDPAGTARREVTAGQAKRLYVHPITVRLPGLTAGLLRDLEGHTTNDLSSSDVAFHTLREYVPGDDRRHISWRSSARHDKLLVRQFVDTRRSHVGLVLSLASAHYRDDDEFEFAVQVVGSIARSTFVEGQAVSGVAGYTRLPETPGPFLLDALSGVDHTSDAPDIAALTRFAAPILLDVSVAMVVVGSAADVLEVRRHAQRFGGQTQVAIIVCDRGSEPDRRRLGNTRVLRVGDLEGLARMTAVVGVR